ncbi:MAG: helix-turn-helix domain-containing protein [Anaerolineae bacterium]|nr:helix-turn-helix domain-containing protein [Anaerolineae bacterium]MDW8099931.1 helix-turn-helix domain-containing protein [Anaerolineae bacterium]
MHNYAVEQAQPDQDTPSPPPGILVSGHFREPFGYHVRRPAGTRDWLVTYTLAGEGRFRLGGLTYPCVAGDLIILAPGVPHDYATARPGEIWEFFWAHFLPRPHWMRWLRLPELAPGLYSLSIGDQMTQRRICRAFERLLQDNQGLGTLREELAANALEEIILLVAQYHFRMASRALDPRVEAVLHQLSQRFSEPLTVSNLASLVSLSPSRLSHLFKEQVGDSIMEMLRKLRLRQAARLLEFTSRQVSEIAQDVGFRSPFYFSRQFKAYYGMSPTAYRGQVQRRNPTPTDRAHEAAEGEA